MITQCQSIILSKVMQSEPCLAWREKFLIVLIILKLFPKWIRWTLTAGGKNKWKKILKSRAYKQAISVVEVVKIVTFSLLALWVEMSQEKIKINCFSKSHLWRKLSPFILTNQYRNVKNKKPTKNTNLS